MPIGADDLFLFSPVLIVLATAGLAVMADVFVPRLERAALPFLSLAGLGASAFMLLHVWGRNQEAFAGGLRADDFWVVVGLTILAATALSVLMSASYVRAAKVDFGEYYGLMLTAASGAMLLAQANDLMNLFLGIEVMSIAVYCLTGITRDREKSTEAALKYFVLGAFSTGFLLFGLAFLYGAVVSSGVESLAGAAAGGNACLRFDLIRHVAGADGPPNHLLVAGAALFLIGAAFKVGAVPFHAWTPDAYEGAPAPVTGFMSAVVKAGAFAALVRISIVAFPRLNLTWMPLVATVAAATMILGNLFALSQSNLKRLLAYSSIAHAGYILVGIVSAGASPAAASSVVFYLLAYAVTTVGSFGLASLLARDGDELETVADFNGLARRRPLAAAAMVLFMASLAGIPPTAGFMGKLMVFREAVRQDYLWLALIGIATSVLSAYYYLKIVVAMYMREPAKDEQFPAGPERWGAALGLAACSAATLALGLCPARVWDWCVAGVRALQ